MAVTVTVTVTVTVRLSQMDVISVSNSTKRFGFKPMLFVSEGETSILLNVGLSQLVASGQASVRCLPGVCGPFYLREYPSLEFN